MTAPSLADAVALYRKTLNVRHKSKTITEVANGCLQSLRRRGAGSQHEQRVSRHLTRFEEDYGDWLACDMTSEVISDWLDNLKVLKTSGKETTGRSNYCGRPVARPGRGGTMTCRISVRAG